MDNVDEWFRHQMLRIRGIAPAPVPDRPTLRRRMLARLRARGPMIAACLALLGGIALLATEMMGEGSRADEPFGLQTPPMFRAAAMPPVNGHANNHSQAGDRNSVIMTGIGKK